MMRQRRYTRLVEPTPTTAALLGEADFVRSLAGGLVYDPGAADDVAQETLLAALENPPAHLASTRGWLATVARNVARQMGRSRTRRTAREAKVALPEDAVPSTLELLEVEEVRGQVVEAVMGLDETDRSVVVLRYYEGLKPAAIADRMGLTANAVSSRLSRAHRKLREVLDARHNGSRAAWVFALGPLLPTHPPAGVAPNDEPSPAPGGLSISALMLSALAVLVAGTVALVPLMLSGEPAQPALADGDPAVQLPPPAPIDRGFDVEVPPRPSTDPPAAEDSTPRGSEPAPAEPPAAKPPSPPAFVPPANRRLRGRVLGWTHGAGESMRISVSPGEPKSERAAAWIGPPKDRPRAHPNTLWKPAGGVERIRGTVAEDGTFELDLGRWWNASGGPLPPPMLVVSLRHSRYESGEYWLRLSDMESEAAANAAAAAGARYWAELGVLRGPNTVVGTVQTADGTPIAGAEVWLLSGKPGPQHLPGGATTRTDEQGRFRLLVKAGAKVAFAVNSEKRCAAGSCSRAVRP
jgi:RNA polymerase sigma-70 factor (ECF subfamily)